MADTKISAMTTASTLTGGEVVPLVQSGANVQVTTSDFVNQTLAVAPSTSRTALGLGTMAVQSASSVAITGGTEAGVSYTNIKTPGLTGYLYGNDTSNATASTTVPFSAVSSQPWIEVADVTSSIVLTSTPTILTGTSSPAANLATVSGSGITYDAATGIFTFAYAGSYALTVSVNCTAASSGQSIYWFAENNTGSGWSVNTNSGKSFALINNAQTQVVASNAVHRVAGQQVRYKFYSNNSNVTIATTTLPSSTAIVPGIRIQYAG